MASLNEGEDTNDVIAVKRSGTAKRKSRSNNSEINDNEESNSVVAVESCEANGLNISSGELGKLGNKNKSEDSTSDGGISQSNINEEQITAVNKKSKRVSNQKSQLKKTDDVPELDDEPPPIVVQKSSKPSASPSIKLKDRERTNSDRKSSVGDDVDDDIQVVPVEKDDSKMVVIEVPDGDDGPDLHLESGSNHLEGMTVIDEVSEGPDDTCEDEKKDTKLNEVSNDNIDPDTEMVSEDELPAETSKEQLETEAVSDEELPTPAADLPETEAVSEDELPPEGSEKKKKKKSSVVAASSTKADAKKEKNIVSKADSEGGVKRKLAEGEYDPSSPTSEASNDDTPPSKKMNMDNNKTQSKPVKPPRLPELEKYWKAVKDDPTDFTGWTYLLQYVDQENDVEAAREAYDAFLSHYPYCYGYWRKYADYEKRKGNKKKCEEVFERGLKAIPLSVDLWIHYLNYCKGSYPDDEEFIRKQFQNALEACGLEFRSDRLWESFIKWETEGKRINNVTQLYDRLLATPTQGYTTHFDNFQEHVKNNPPAKVLSVDEFLTLRREVLQVLKQYDTPMETVPERPPGDDDAPPPGEEPPEACAASDEETTALRERIISIRRKIHKTTVAAVSARYTFEEGIKRPYFHVKPLERCQLTNWKDYLDFEIEQDDKQRIIILFERCLIACALYEEFWVKFLRYLEDLPDNNVDKIRDVFERACTIHHPKKPNLHLYWAVFEENQGNFEKAREILVNLEKIVPNFLQVAYRRINLERRAENLDGAASLYEHYINTVKSKIVANNLAVKYARFSWKVLNDTDKSIAILKKALEKDKENPRLYLQLIDMYIQKSPIPENEVIAIMDQFINRDSADIDQKVIFAQRKVEFLEDFGTNVLLVQKANDEFKRYVKVVKEKKKKSMEAESVKLSKSEDSKKSSKTESNQHNSLSVPPSSQLPQSSLSVSQASGQSAPPPNYSAPPYPMQGPPGGYQSGNQGYTPQQPPPPPPYNQGPYNHQSDPNYSYQGWNYSQPGYGGGYNQGWGNYYNY